MLNKSVSFCFYDSSNVLRLCLCLCHHNYGKVVTIRVVVVKRFVDSDSLFVVVVSYIDISI